MSENNLTHPCTQLIHYGNLLNPAVRRDITGLNRLFLERVLDPTAASDPWFRVPGPAVVRLTQATPEARERAAHSPMALFQVALPEPGDTRAWRSDAVADAAGLDEVDRSHVEMRRSFGLAALEVVRRLAEGVPLSPRIAFGMGPAAEAQLAALSIAESYRLASWPALIRPRWPGHTRYWEALAQAANGTGGDGLRWTYATGLCLLGQCERQPPQAGQGPRRAARPSHGRDSQGGADVPC